MSGETLELSEAIRKHESGDWQSAQTVYRKILDGEPQNAEVLHLLGMSCLAAGDLVEASVLIRRAILLDPFKPFYYTNLAAVLHAQGNLPAAEQSCRKAVSIDPKSYDGWNNLGGILIAKGNRIEAEEALRTAVEINPEAPNAQINLGNLLMEQGKWSEAADAFETVLSADPGNIDARYSLGVAQLALNLPAAAVENFRRCFPAREEDPHAHYNLGMALLKTERHAAAVETLNRCLELKPDYPDAQCILGICLLKFRRREEAEKLFRDALRQKPTLALCYNGLGFVENARGNRSKEMEYTRKAIELDPDCVPAHINLACQYLVQGDLENGWREYQWIRRAPGVSAARFREGTWDGSPLGGRTLAICAEQGYGDLIQFIRYAPLAKQRGAGKVVLQCAKPLHRLLRHAPGVDEVVLPEEDLPKNCAIAPVLDLPRIFETTLTTIPQSVPYLNSRVGLAPKLRAAIERAKGRKVGLAWHGNPDHIDDDTRSMPARHFAALKDAHGLQLFSFQKGHGCEETAELAKALPVVEGGSQIKDLAESARAMQMMDLVISVDTSVIHLAGALGKPAWLLLPYIGEWRWMLDRADSPWYPTMRIFRQKRPGDWEGVMRQVLEALR